jgi:Domain of unknown function (DUF4252)
MQTADVNLAGEIMMKSYKYFLLSAVLPLFLLLASAAANAQDARLRFENLNKLEDKASDVVEVNIDGKLLETAKRAMTKVSDEDTKKVAQAISGLKGIYVRVYNFEKENDYNVSDVEQVRSQMQSPGWEKLVNVRSKKNNQKIDVFTMFAGDLVSGVTVVVSEAKTIAVVNVVGAIDIDTLVELSGKMNIPKIDIEKDAKKNQLED